VVSDGLEARIGTLSSNKERFKPWRTIEGEALAKPPLHEPAGGADPRRVRAAALLDLLRTSSCSRTTGTARSTRRSPATTSSTRGRGRAAVAPRSPASRHGGQGDRRVGVVWHTQGSGKSLTMAFYAGRVVLHPAMQNPTLVVLTDRNDLDDQLFGSSRAARTCCARAPSRPRPRAPARAAQGRLGRRGVHDHPEVLPPRRAGDRSRCSPSAATSSSSPTRRTAASTTSSTASPRHMRDALPNASFIGFTGTPIEFDDKNTRRCSATTSASTTSSARSRTARRCRSTTRAGSRSSSSPTTRSPSSTRPSRS
jgi:type I restriction enzyme R subunit